MKLVNLTLFLCINLVTYAQPVLELDTNVITLEPVNYAGNLDIRFNVTNTGNEPLIITSVKGNGGSLVCHSYPREPIPPGETRVIKFLYDTKRIGKFTKSGTIQSNCSIESIRMIKVKGEIVSAPVARFEKEKLVVGSNHSGSSNFFVLSNHGTEPLVITKIEKVNHDIPIVPAKDTIPIGEFIHLSFVVNSNQPEKENFDLTWRVYTNAGDSAITISAKGKATYSPLVFMGDTVKNLTNSNSKLFQIECYNNSYDTIVIKRVSKEPLYEFERIWMCGKSYHSAEEYTIPPFGKSKILIAYTTAKDTIPELELFFNSINKRSNAKYVNGLKLVLQE